MEGVLEKLKGKIVDGVQMQKLNGNISGRRSLRNLIGKRGEHGCVALISYVSI